MGLMSPPSVEDREAMRRAEALERFEEIASLDKHGELVRLILTEAALLTAKYRCVRRHDVPHIAELTGLLDLLWQEQRAAEAQPTALLD